ncbi:dTDP-4-dehydrorhamnose 3,5-epimerase family protein [Micromonospora sp. WMMD714]|uniref:dTDP-4-dehydrorhamnose 3,5-epimerase family protein n=1 Tax=Micromonospora sp. WMMD714 TaxID=3016097 RepID=UPI00249BA737|nr:dTDP-4-dehydrorhamnose 3,5-epimerase family protein [Micromonospora sp. WMMD714]WFE63015.1 dTDP-4-dehydrorhamnose 3,5-epimerase family protein [Micromonospora sp. WMMD714]
MKARELAVAGAFEFRTTGFPDERGVFTTPLDTTVFLATVGRPLFPVAQACVSRSRRNVFRGVHYTQAPPGRAKYVWCAHGRCRDYVIDLRVGSPTFGRYEVVDLAGDCARALYLPIGVGHAFLARDDDTVMSYLLSGGYVPEREHGLDPFDRDLALPVPTGPELLLSDRDRAAPSLAEALRQGLLPVYADCVRAERAVPA